MKHDWNKSNLKFNSTLRSSVRAVCSLSFPHPRRSFVRSFSVSGKSRRAKTSDTPSNFDSDEDHSSADEKPAMKIKLKKSAESNATPPAKRRPVRKSVTPDAEEEEEEEDDGTAEFGQTLNGSSGESPSSFVNEKKSARRPRLSKPSVITNNGEHSAKKSLTKPRALLSKAPQPVSSLNDILAGQHHRFDIRTGFLSPFEEQEVFDAIDQLKGNKTTFDEAEQSARRRFEQILCLNLNRTHVDIPEECKSKRRRIESVVALLFLRVSVVSLRSSSADREECSLVHREHSLGQGLRGRRGQTHSQTSIDRLG